MDTNAPMATVPQDKGAEVEDLLAAVQSLLIPFISNANVLPGNTEASSSPVSDSGIDGRHTKGIPAPKQLLASLNFQLPEEGLGRDGLMGALGAILGNSVNTWSQGFMSKLYASTNAVGVVSELILAVLNTAVSPALTVIEKETSKKLASLFGLTDKFAGGITAPGGSASNLTAVVIARNSLYPETKVEGYGSRKLVMFTSAEGHYSHEKAAQVCGLGSVNCWPVPVDDQGRMLISELQKLVNSARQKGYTPFFVNATAGTTVLGAYDPLPEIGQLCKAENLWFHIDASWGGSVVFSETHKSKMRGSELADSLTVNPHKMMGVPVSCSFLLGADIRKFWAANTLPAGYLFHGSGDEGTLECGTGGDMEVEEVDEYREVWDLGDLTLQCGRRGDSLKLALGWIFYGRRGYEAQIDKAFGVAGHLATIVTENDDLLLVSENPPPCLQVCFYYTGGNALGNKKEMTRRTREIAKRLVSWGFLVDHAPGPGGNFFRVVVNLYTEVSTIERLIKNIVALGKLGGQEVAKLDL